MDFLQVQLLVVPYCTSVHLHYKLEIKKKIFYVILMQRAPRSNN